MQHSLSFWLQPWNPNVRWRPHEEKMVLGRCPEALHDTRNLGGRRQGARTPRVGTGKDAAETAATCYLMKMKNQWLLCNSKSGYWHSPALFFSRAPQRCLHSAVWAKCEYVHFGMFAVLSEFWKYFTSRTSFTHPIHRHVASHMDQSGVRTVLFWPKNAYISFPFQKTINETPRTTVKTSKDPKIQRSDSWFDRHGSPWRYFVVVPRQRL